MEKRGSILVLGGGPAGLASALKAAEAGVKVYLVEQESMIGGQAVDYGCKAGEKCNQCNLCLLFPAMEKTVSHPNIQLMLNSRVSAISGQEGAYQVTVNTIVPAIDSLKCINCGRCKTDCEAAAIKETHPRGLPHSYRIDQSKCVRVTGQDCSKCQSACPAGAVNYTAGSNTVEVSSIIIAVGSQPFNPKEQIEYSYTGAGPVMTGAEFEQALSQGLPSELLEGEKKVAFIQCVGSRTEKGGRQYCSRVCCMYALRMSRALKKRNPQADMTIYYMDLQLVGQELQDLYQACLSEDQTAFRRGIPSRIDVLADGKAAITYEDINTGKYGREQYDKVILSVGLTPRAAIQDLAAKLELPIEPTGFFQATDGTEGVQSPKGGIYYAGSCQGPRDISQSMAHGQKAATAAIYRLRELAEK